MSSIFLPTFFLFVFLLFFWSGNQSKITNHMFFYRATNQKVSKGKFAYNWTKNSIKINIYYMYIPFFYAYHPCIDHGRTWLIRFIIGIVFQKVHHRIKLHFPHHRIDFLCIFYQFIFSVYMYVFIVCICFFYHFRLRFGNNDNNLKFPLHIVAPGYLFAWCNTRHFKWRKLIESLFIN